MIAYAVIKTGTKEELKVFAEQINNDLRQHKNIFQFVNSFGISQTVGRIILTYIEDDKLIAKMEIKGDVTQEMQKQLQISLKKGKSNV